MKPVFASLLSIVILALFICQPASAQVMLPSDTLPAPVRDTVVKYKVVYNTDFDVIIKRNGEIMYGLVKEVGLELIKYQRTDIPNGPVYTIPKFEVYAISYRNQVRDIINPVNDPRLINPPAYGTPGYGSNYVPGYDYSRNQDNRYYGPRKSFLSQNGDVILGIGFIRGFTKVKNAGSYSSSSSPVINIAYDALYRDKVRLGAMIAFGSHKFSGQDYSSYDSTQSAISIKENFFALYVYGKYSYTLRTSPFQPYALVGLGLNSANIKSTQEVNFLNRTDKIIQVSSGARAVGLGILARVGADYYVNSRFRVFADVGAGPYILNLGIAAHVK